ncbi:MAG: phage tail tape measure protein [Carboxydocellales bacterium]
MGETQEIGNIGVGLSFDSTGFTTGMASINRQLKVAQAEFQTASSKLGQLGNATDKMQLQTDSLAKQLELQKQKVTALSAAYDKSVEAKGADAKASQDLLIKLLKAQKQEADIENALKKTNQMIEQQSSVWHKLSTSMATVGDRLKDVGGKMSAAGRTLSTTVTAPLVGAGIAAVKFAGDFGDGMAKISTIADATKVPLDQLKKGIRELSDQTGITTKDLTEAEYEAISAGVDTANSVQFLGTAVKAAKGGFTDATTTVDGLTTVLNAYGKKAEEATDISDQMMLAQNFGKTTWGQMAASMGNVIPIAANLGVSTKELFGSLGVLTKNGIKTSEAVTGLKSAFSNIMKPAKEASDLAKQLGLDFNAAHLQSVGWAKFLEEVKQKTGGNAEQMAKLFGSVEALNSVMVLTGKGSGDLNSVLKQMENTTGLTQQAFDKVSGTPSQKLYKAFNQIKNSVTELAEKSAPAIEKLAKVLGGLAEKFGQLSPVQQEFIIKMAVLAAAIGPALMVLGNLSTGIGKVSGAIAKAGGMANLFSGALTFLTSPVGIAIAAIAALAAVAYLIYKNWDTIKAKTTEVWNAVKNTIVGIWESIKTKTSEIWEGIKTFFEKWWPLLLVVFTGGIGLIIAYIIGHWDGIKKKTSEIWEAIKNFFVKYWDSLKYVFGPVAVIATYVIQHWDKIKETTSRVFEAIRKAVSEKFNAVKDTVSNIVTSIKGIFDETIGAAWDWGRNLIQTFIDGIKSKISVFTDTLEGISNEIKDFLGFSSPTKKGPGSQADKWAPNFMEMFVGGLQDNMPELSAKINDLAARLNFTNNVAVSRTAFAGMGGVIIRVNVSGNYLANSVDEDRLADKVSQRIGAEFLRSIGGSR